MSGSMGLAFKISATDEATAKMDLVLKRINELAKGSAQSGKSVAKIGESTGGISKLSEGMLSLSNSSLGAFRSIEQMVSPITAITSAASIAGIMALEKAWGSAGNTMNKTAYALSMPVNKLSGLQQGFKLAGSSAEAAEKTVSGMNETLHAAFYGRDATAQSNLNALGIDWKDEKGNIADTQVALGKLANWMQSHKDPHAQTRALTSVGGDADALVALKDGQKGLDEWVAKAEQTGSVWTKQMADNATGVQHAFSRLEEDLQGIGNRIANNWSGTATTVMGKTSQWIENNKGLADSFTNIGLGILALGALKPAAWLLRLLGLGSLIDVVAPLALPLALSGDAGPNSAGVSPEQEEANRKKAIADGAVTPGQWWRKHAPTWAGGDPDEPAAAPAVDRSHGPWRQPNAAGAPGASAPSVPYEPLATNNLLEKLANSKLGKLLARGESGAADYNAVNRGAAGGYAAGMENLVNMTVGEVQAAQKAHKFNAAGKFQIIGPTLDSAVSTLGLTGKEKFDKPMQDRIFEQYLVGSKRKEIGDYITGKSDNLPAALMGMSKEWASVADPTTGKSHYGGVGNNKASISVDEATQALNEARVRLAAAATPPTRPGAQPGIDATGQPVQTAANGPAPGDTAAPPAAGQTGANGHVLVEIVHKNAPTGTTTKVTSSGAVAAPPPRVETAMAGAGR